MVTMSLSENQGMATGVDDLKQIPGIGASVEERLRQAGITTYERLAAATPQELAVVLAGLVGYTPDRIIKQDWAGQAARLHEIQPTRQSDRQRYAVFTLELLLDPDNQVRRTHLLNVQTHQDATWAGWDTERLLGFISTSAELSLPAVEAEDHEPNGEPVSQTVQPIQSNAADSQVPLQHPAHLTGTVVIQGMVFFNQRGVRLNKLVPVNEPFQIHLTVDLSQLHTPVAGPITLAVEVFAKQIGGKGRTLIAHGEDMLYLEAMQGNGHAHSSSPIKTIQLHGAIHDPGDYRIEAIAAVHPTDDPAGSENQLLGYVEGLFVRIY